MSLIIVVPLVFSFFLSQPAAGSGGVHDNEQSETDPVSLEESSGTHSVENNIENKINGENSNVSNTIDNHLNHSDHNNVENNVTNNIEVNVDVNVSNHIQNHVSGHQNGTSEKDEEPETGGENGESEPVWGVDSASLTTDELLACVKDHFGSPKVWGRYLGDKEGVSKGLTSDEVDLLHANEIKILTIWNHFTNATGYENGETEAEQAVQKANELGVPEGVAIFANIEPNYEVDAEFIKGWFAGIEESEYEAGIYGIFDSERALSEAFQQAGEDEAEIAEQTYLWTAAPNVGVTAEANAPEFNPEGPDGANIGGWQYGIDASTCNIDTNLFQSDLLDVLW